MSIVLQPTPPSLSCSRYEEARSKEWDAFVCAAQNGCLFHSRTFLQYHPKGRYVDNSLIFSNGTHVVALLPGARVKTADGRLMLQSHPGASWGGFVIAERPRLSQSSELIKSLLSYLADEGIAKVSITLAPDPYWDQPDCSLEFELKRIGFTRQLEEMTSVVSLLSPMAKDSRSTSFERNARKAEASGLTVLEVNAIGDFMQFYDLLCSRLSHRHGVLPTHSLAEVLRLKELLGNRIRLFATYAESEMVAGVLCLEQRSDVTLAFYIAHNPLFQYLRPVDLVFHHLLASYRARRFRFVDLGLCSRLGQPNRGLARFKEKIGAHHSFRTTWELDL